jgi:hypothetical protein
MSKAARLYLDYWKNILPWTLVLCGVILVIKFFSAEFKPTEFEMVLAVMMACIFAAIVFMFLLVLKKFDRYESNLKKEAEMNVRKLRHANAKADKTMHA